jgi:hypothetical protein
LSTDGFTGTIDTGSADAFIAHIWKVTETETVVVHNGSIPKTLENIRIYESPKGHYETVNEKKVVVVRTNTNSAKDIGKFQPNTVWEKEWKAMHLDPYNEQDNKAFAMHLCETYGVRHWYSSINCWLGK